MREVRTLKDAVVFEPELDETPRPKKRAQKQVQFDVSGYDTTDVFLEGRAEDANVDGLPCAADEIDSPGKTTPHGQLHGNDATSTIETVPSVLPLPLPNRFHICLLAQKRAILKAFVSLPSLGHLQDENSMNSVAFQHLSALLSGTVERGEGNSCILLGPPGSGKTHVR